MTICCSLLSWFVVLYYHISFHSYCFHYIYIAYNLYPFCLPLFPFPICLVISYEINGFLRWWFSWLKLHSLFAAWLFWTFHTKSHNVKALVILCHSWSSFHPLTCWYGKNELLWVSVWPSGVLSWGKTPPRLPMHITWAWPPVNTILSWHDYCKTKENVNITLLDSVHVNESTLHWL